MASHRPDSKKSQRGPKLQPGGRSCGSGSYLVFGRKITKHLFDTYSPNWSPEMLQCVRDDLQAFLLMTWKEYYNPDVYRDAGLDEPYELQEMAWQHPACIEHRKEVSGVLTKYLLENGILEEVLAFV